MSKIPTSGRTSRSPLESPFNPGPLPSAFSPAPRSNRKSTTRPQPNPTLLTSSWSLFISMPVTFGFPSDTLREFSDNPQPPACSVAPRSNLLLDDYSDSGSDSDSHSDVGNREKAVEPTSLPPHDPSLSPNHSSPHTSSLQNSLTSQINAVPTPTQIPHTNTVSAHRTFYQFQRTYSQVFLSSFSQSIPTLSNNSSQFPPTKQSASLPTIISSPPPAPLLIPTEINLIDHFHISLSRHQSITSNERNTFLSSISRLFQSYFHSSRQKYYQYLRKYILFAMARQEFAKTPFSNQNTHHTPTNLLSTLHTLHPPAFTRTSSPFNEFELQYKFSETSSISSSDPSPATPSSFPQQFPFYQPSDFLLFFNQLSQSATATITTNNNNDNNTNNNNNNGQSICQPIVDFQQIQLTPSTYLYLPLTFHTKTPSAQDRQASMPVQQSHPVHSGLATPHPMHSGSATTTFHTSHPTKVPSNLSKYTAHLKEAFKHHLRSFLKQKSHEIWKSNSLKISNPPTTPQNTPNLLQSSTTPHDSSAVNELMECDANTQHDPQCIFQFITKHLFPTFYPILPVFLTDQPKLLLNDEMTKVFHTFLFKPLSPSPTASNHTNQTLHPSNPSTNTPSVVPLSIHLIFQDLIGRIDKVMMANGKLPYYRSPIPHFSFASSPHQLTSYGRSIINTSSINNVKNNNNNNLSFSTTAIPSISPSSDLQQQHNMFQEWNKDLQHDKRMQEEFYNDHIPVVTLQSVHLHTDKAASYQPTTSNRRQSQHENDISNVTPLSQTICLYLSHIQIQLGPDIHIYPIL